MRQCRRASTAVKNDGGADKLPRIPSSAASSFLFAGTLLPAPFAGVPRARARNLCGLCVAAPENQTGGRGSWAGTFDLTDFEDL